MIAHEFRGRAARTVYIEASAMAEPHLAGIGRYTARLALALARYGASVRFFHQGHELIAPGNLSWALDQDLERWGHAIAWSGPKRPLEGAPHDAIGVYPCLRPDERLFPYEISILHDFTPVVVPHTHMALTVEHFQRYFHQTLLRSDAAIADSHSTKADAEWLCDFDPDRIAVGHCGPSMCVERHLHRRPVRRRPRIGLAVSTLEPRKNAPFLLDWFRNTTALPDDAELWWVGRVGWLTCSKLLKGFQRRPGRRVRLLGVVSDAQLCRLYQSAGWFIYPSLYEGFGLPVLDALRHGTPVLTSGNSSLREFPHRGVYLFDPCDADTLDGAFQELRAAQPIAIDRTALDTQYNWDRLARIVCEFPERAPRRRSVAHSGTLSLSA